MHDAATVWRHLRAEGCVDGEPPSDAAGGGPWVVRLLVGIAAWIASLLFLGFLTLFLGDLALKETAGVAIGVLLCVATMPFLRRPSGEFTQQCATVASIAGIALIGIGLGAGFDLLLQGVAIVLVAISAALFAVSRVETHRFLCAVTFVAASLWLIEDMFGRGLALLQPIAACSAAALWWLDLSAEPASTVRRHVMPIAWAVTLAAGMLWWFVSNGWWIHDDTSLAVVACYVTALLLPATALAIGWSMRDRGDSRLFWLLVIAAVALAWLWRWSPGVTFALVLMLLAFARGAAVLLAFSVASLAIYLVAYYYQLDVPLLDKSLWLGLAGIVLLALYIMLRWWPMRRMQ